MSNDITPDDIAKVQAHLRKTFGSEAITLRARAKAKDSAEVLVGDEFIGLVYRDFDEGELSFHFEMAILSEDL